MQTKTEVRWLATTLLVVLSSLGIVAWLDTPVVSPVQRADVAHHFLVTETGPATTRSSAAHTTPPPAGQAWVRGRLSVPADAPSLAHPRVVYVETPEALQRPRGGAARTIGEDLAFGPLALPLDSNHLVLARVGLAVTRKGFLVTPGKGASVLDLGILQLTESPSIELYLLGEEDLRLEIAHVEGTQGSEAYLLSDAGAWALGPKTLVPLRPGVSYLLAPFVAAAMYELVLVDAQGRRSAKLRAATREIGGVRVDLDPTSIDRSAPR